jgi:hypothetical protein
VTIEPDDIPSVEADKSDFANLIVEVDPVFGRTSANWFATHLCCPEAAAKSTVPLGNSGTAYHVVPAWTKGASELKTAYLMLFHKDPQLLRRAIKVLSSTDCGFFVHIDGKSDFQQFSTITLNNVFFCEKRIPVHWGEFSQIEATMLLLEEALVSAANYDYFVFLQGSTYPLRSGAYIQRFLEQNRAVEFMNAVRMPAPGYALSKINTLRYPSDKPLRRFTVRALAKLGLAQRDYRKYLPGIEAYSGHACWALSRDACRHIARFVTSNPHFVKYFRNTFAPDESFFQTILGNSPFRANIRKNLVYADWSASRGDHPAMLNDGHLRFFEAREKVWVEDEWGAGEMLFARKLSDDRLDLAERIDEMIKRREDHDVTSLAQANR